MTERDARVLHEPWVMSFDYTRTTGPVIGRFFAGLSQRVVWGQRTKEGRVIVPPTGYDPESGAPLNEWVQVSEAGVVSSWTWVQSPLPAHPLPRPFAWALIRLDGADTAMLHAVDTGDAARMKTGMRVRIRWAAPTSGHITDIACFEPAPSSGPTQRSSGAKPSFDPQDAQHLFTYPMRLHYRVTAGFALSRALRRLADGVFVGQRCPSCRRVYMPPLGACSICATLTTEDVSLPDTGTVTTFVLVNIPIRGQGIETPFACAEVQLDGADTTFLALIQGCDISDVHVGMRVVAVWAPPGERTTNLSSLRHFRPLAPVAADA